MIATDEDTVVASLLSLADEYERKATQLRQAAAIVTGQPGKQEGDQQPARTREPQIGRVPALSAQDYLSVIDSEPPDHHWDGASLATQIEAKFDRETTTDSARTMLTRLEKRGLMHKSGRGTWSRATPDLRTESSI